MHAEKGVWRSRGYLPHFDAPDRVQMITFRLIDSLPESALLRIKDECSRLSESARKAETARRLELYLNAGHGACWLRRPDVAARVEAELLAGDGLEYRLLSWTIMPNHVHVLVELSEGIALSELMRRWKGRSSVAANRLLGRSGPFWYREYHDRYIRDGDHLANARHYIDENPVKARLCSRAEDWPFGSARLGA